MDSITGIILLTDIFPSFAMPSVFSGDSVESGECKIECPAGFTGRDDAVGYTDGKCVCVNDNTYQYN